jgi:hypothetical protein
VALAVSVVVSVEFAEDEVGAEIAMGVTEDEQMTGGPLSMSCAPAAAFEISSEAPEEASPRSVESAEGYSQVMAPLFYH